MKRQPRLVFTYANDAGGAAIIASYMRHFKQIHRYVAFACGPAARIYKRLGIAVTNSKPELESARLAMTAKLKEIQPAFFLCGTGGPPHLEIEIIHLCKQLGIRSCAFVDHWVNYRERFGYPDPWKKNLPDEIWAGDADALRRAKFFFARYTRVRYVSNPYLRDIKNNYRALPKKETDCILFISEPVVTSEKRPVRVTEKELLRMLLTHLDQHWPDIKVVIRLHPSEPRDKYYGLVRSFVGRSYRVAQGSQNLLENLHSAFIVVGMESMALVVADKCGKDILRFPPYHLRKTDAPIPGQVATTHDLFVRRLDYYVQQHLKRS
jgi:hypothetical protein